MSAPPDRAAARCACTNISLMQLFHELKQKFPGAPDHAVSGAIAAYCHDKRACETHLESQAEASLTHAYHASSSAAARRLRDLRDKLTPLECRNRPLETRQFPSTAAVQVLPCHRPQNAELSATPAQETSNIIEPIQATTEDYVESNADDALVEAKNDIIKPNIDDVRSRAGSDASPITINIDSCVEKSCETPSDIESDEASRKQHPSHDEDKTRPAEASEDRAESTNYRILKSNKIRSNLNERLERTKGKKLIGQQAVEKDPQEAQPPKEASPEKPKRPCTLEFIKPQPDPNLTRQTIPEPVPEPCRTLSPAPPASEPFIAPPPFKESAPSVAHGWPEYPLNLSVNVNVDIPNRPRAQYPEGWPEEYESGRSFASVNLTVCTPTSAMQSPAREAGGFEGHLTVTVSPSTARAPRRPAPPPPAPAHHILAAPAADQLPANSNAALLARQRDRKAALMAALAKERESLRRVEREVALLRAPPPPPADERRLRERLEWLRAQCQRLVAMQPPQVCASEERLPSRAPSRPAPPPPDDPPKWQCRVCTFENHGSLNMCEQCDMLRNIELGTLDAAGDAARRLDAGVVHGADAVERHAGRACV